MANIATLLARILTTRYGRDMRQDLHDSIEAVNDDTETALGKKLTFTTNTRKLKLLAKDDTVLSEVVIPGGGSGGGSVDSVNGQFPDENGNVELNLDDINDVDITSAEDGDALIYDSTSGKWVNGSGGGGTSDYTQLTNKPSINGVTLSGNKTSKQLGIFAPTITSPTSGQVIKYDGSNWVNGSVSGGSNRNLLDNPWFTVNQKGFTSGSIATIGESVPFIDRWKGNYQTSATSSISLSSNQLTLTIPSGVGCGISQGNEVLQKLTSGTATVSIMFADNTVISKNITLSATPTVYQLGTYNDLTIDYRHYATLNAFLFVFNNNSDSQKAVTIKAVKFELGTESTLALDVEPNYTEELLKCQRYYYPLSSKSLHMGRVFLSGLNENISDAVIMLPTAMRTTPTYNGALTGNDFNGHSNTLTNIEVEGNQDIIIRGTWGSTGSTPTYGAGYVQFGYPNQPAYLSAEL